VAERSWQDAGGLCPCMALWGMGGGRRVEETEW